MGGFSIISPLGQFPSLVAIMVPSLDIPSGGFHWVSFNPPGWQESSLWCQFRTQNGMTVSVYHSLSGLLSCFEDTIFCLPPSRCTKAPNCVDFRAWISMHVLISWHAHYLQMVQVYRESHSTVSLILGIYRCCLLSDDCHGCCLILPIMFVNTSNSMSLLPFAPGWPASADYYGHPVELQIYSPIATIYILKFT